jgi:hypothetical protein
MSTQDHAPKGTKTTEEPGEVRRPYQAPRILDESTFERLRLACPQFGGGCIDNPQLSG